MTKVNQPTAAPTAKVAASGVAGAVSIILVYLIQQVFATEIPAEVASSLTVVISFATGYLVKENA